MPASKSIGPDLEDKHDAWMDKKLCKHACRGSKAPGTKAEGIIENVSYRTTLN